MDFGDQVADFCRTAEREAEKDFRRRLEKTFTAVINSTPVGKPELYKVKPPKGYKPGKLRGDWTLDVNSVPMTNRQRVDPSGSQAKTELSNRLKNIKLTDTVFFANNRPYAGKIEYVQGGSIQQGPEAMIRKNLPLFLK